MNSWLNRCLTGLLIAALWAAWPAAVGLAASAMPKGFPTLGAAPATAPAPAAPRPLVQESPRDAVIGLIAACTSEDEQRAALHLDLRYIDAEQRLAEALPLACQAKAVLDRVMPTKLKGVSTEPGGPIVDGTVTNLTRLVTVPTPDGPVSLYLERYTLKSGDSYWRLSPSSIERLPALYERYAVDRWEKQLPRFLVEQSFLDVKLWQWLALLTLVLIAVALAQITGHLANRMLQRFLPTADVGLLIRLTVDRSRHPLRLLLALGVFSVGMTQIDFSLSARTWLQATERVLSIVAFAWLILHLVDAACDLLRMRLISRGKASAALLLPMVQRSGRVLVLAAATLVLMNTLGINVTALAAGLGVGGLVVALAAQKTVENLFGGMVVTLDQPVRVGDFCRFGTQVGTVEDIGLRSTRIRTQTRTVVTIPNGEFSQMQIENFSKRDKMFFTTLVQLEHGVSAARLRLFLANLRSLLAADPRVESATLDVRLVSLGGQTTDVEAYGYVLTPDWNTFKAIREDLYLKIIELIASEKLSFGVPTRIVYNAGPDPITAAPPPLPALRLNPEL